MIGVVGELEEREAATATCSSCHRELPVDAFGVEARSVTGRRSICGDCRSAADRARRADQRARQAQHRARAATGLALPAIDLRDLDLTPVGEPLPTAALLVRGGRGPEQVSVQDLRAWLVNAGFALDVLGRTKAAGIAS